MKLKPEISEALLELARLSIRAGLDSGNPCEPDIGGCPAELLERRACFVTLITPRDGLRGCRGLLDARHPLASAVWLNAWASAFADPRFRPVTGEELGDLVIDISILGPLIPLRLSSEQELLEVLAPGVDGVVLSWRGRQATFLPKVWDMLPEPAGFLRQLKLKAGLPAHFWAADIEVCRYQAQSVRGRMGHRVREPESAPQ